MTTMPNGGQLPPRNGHVHSQYWTEREHERFEDRLTPEIQGLRNEVRLLANRLTLILGAGAVVIFLINMLAPIFQGLFGIQVEAR